MRKKQPYGILNIVVLILVCCFLYLYNLLAVAICLFIAVGYLAYEAYKK
ncbi:hypothetical protein [Candidatus Clostridium radicumherbarum]|uniref:Phosphatidate cytidylyltransferase n=1 Tax=Candidatus Clostridium radicumherbarum TaxID=3381662 RepID=A0ABW8TRH9_9CLOT